MGEGVFQRCWWISLYAAHIQPICNLVSLVIMRLVVKQPKLHWVYEVAVLPYYPQPSPPPSFFAP